MKKGLLVALGIILLAGAVLAQGYPFQPVYVFSGTVLAGDGGNPPDGDWAIVTKSQAEYESGIYGFDIIGPTGASGLPNHYSTNAYSSTFLMNLKAGDTVLVGTVKDSAGYGAGPREYTVTGKGFDLVPEMTKTLGGGMDPPPPPAGLGAPIFEEIWFGNRLYQIIKDQPFIVSPTPLIKAVLSAQGDSGIKQESVSIIIDEGEAGSKTFGVTDFATGLSVKTVGALVSSMNVEYQLTSADKLGEGAHTVTFRASDASGIFTTAEVCTVTVMGGPANILGPVVVNPTPYSPSKDPNPLTIQFTLTVDADLEIFVYSVAGEVVKKLYGRKGQEGGSAGTNKITWDAKSTWGTVLGNGIYNAVILDPSQGKTLAKFKLTIFH